MRILFCRLLLFSLVISAPGCATVAKHKPIGFWSRNRFDGQDQRHGPWREYFDGAEQHLANRGRYRHGRSMGIWHYYTLTGAQERTERFYRRPYGLVRLSYFHPGGQLAKQGQARYRAEASVARFYWFGEWKCYSPTGQALPSEFYRNGHRTATLLTTPTGDTLASPVN
ncbi:toxin-antitoxin system YwqK family antitoxin [Hymenobacter perfusus]|uniref:Toxin-antitoxin system YwqK family antitoxin n=1 Tax=Hymenobacter perfusus TaxID=1236770 RepID=A0A3R9N2M8_9BACT|nr:hypothetical protein [Hymenobacter perfusus]RSK46699.1 hypothetical protein EI293_05990 [Hymenobacter perfusus]